MTQTLGINSNNDIYLKTNGKIALLSGVQAVMAACQTAAQAQLGEMVLSVNNGIPNFQAVWNGKPNIAMFEAYFRKAVLAVAGVVSIESIETTVNNNILSYTATIKTEYGLGTLNG